MTGYSDQPIPLRSYAALAGVFNAGMAAALLLLREDLPERVSVSDVVLVGVATHKYSRLVGKDRVTSALRAPFVRYQEDAGPSEVEEAARGEGPRKAIGELISCPYCLDLWIASGFTVGLIAAPRATRLIAGIGASVALADTLHLAYAKAEGQR